MSSGAGIIGNTKMFEGTDLYSMFFYILKYVANYNVIHPGPKMGPKGPFKTVSRIKNGCTYYVLVYF